MELHIGSKSNKKSQNIAQSMNAHTPNVIPRIYTNNVLDGWNCTHTGSPQTETLMSSWTKHHCLVYISCRVCVRVTLTDIAQNNSKPLFLLNELFDNLRLTYGINTNYHIGFKLPSKKS